MSSPSKSTNKDMEDTTQSPSSSQQPENMSVDESKGSSSVPSSPTQNKSLSDPVNRCLTMIKKAKQDTEKFAALLMVTKLTKANDLDDEGRKQLIDAIGLVFLTRMIKSNEAPDGCPPYMYKSIAVTILTCFASCCHGNPTLYGVIPTLSEIISNPDEYEENIMLVTEAYQCLEIIASEKQGKKAIIDYEAISALVESYVNENYGHDRALFILRSIMNDSGPKMWEDEPEAFEKLMNSVSLDFSAETGEHKFELCDVLIDILHSLPDCHEKNDSWKSSLHKGICDIIFSKLEKTHREKGLHLASAILETLGVVWVVNTGEKGQQLLLLMVHLACIEVRMSLEDKSFTEAVSLALSTTACYSIIENAIKFLINGAIELEEKQKQQLYAALKGAFTAVLLFLKEVFTDEARSNNYRIQMFICATIRVLGAWLAEETSANKEEVYEILPFLVKMALFNFEWNMKADKLKKKNLKNQTQPLSIKDNLPELPDLLRFLLPGLCHLTAEDIPRYILLELEIEKFLFDYLNVHWENVKHVFIPPAKGDDDPVTEDSKVSSDAMVTICNIFMNIVVQEPERIKTNKFYYTLLKFIFNRVPNVPIDNTYLQLCGSMCTLGLMVLRHQHSNVKNSDFTILRFVQTTVRFLWDAHNVEESQDYATLVVSARYEVMWEDLMELWFLGMHTLSILLPSIPWLCDFLIETEWPHTIVTTLLSVREGGLEDGIKSAYEDFLCTLVRSSKPSLVVLKERGVVNLCKNHKFDELLKAVNESDIS